VRLVDALNRDDRNGLSLNVGLAVGAALVLNGVIFVLGWNKMTDYAPQPWFQPPGWVVAVVWLLLFALMGRARWLLNSYTIVGVVRARRMVTLLVLSCLLWPFYSLAIGSVLGGLVGTVVTLVLAVVALALVRTRSREAALLLIPVVVWLSYATLIILATLGWL
jgi:benzodiazapine receptor